MAEKQFHGNVITVKVTPGAKKNLIKEESGRLKVYTTAKAVEGKANDAIIKFLSSHFAVKKSQISIIKGLKSREKVITLG